MYVCILKWLHWLSWFFAYDLPSTCAILCFKEIMCTGSPKITDGTSFWNLVPNCGHGTFCHGTPTISKCDMNSDSGQSSVDSTWRVGGHGRVQTWHYGLWLISIGSIYCGLVVQLVVQIHNKSIRHSISKFEPCRRWLSSCWLHSTYNSLYSALYDWA